MRTEEHPPGYLPVAETSCDKVGAAQLGADTGHAGAFPEPVIQLMSLPQPGYSVVVATVSGQGQGCVLHGGGAGERDRVAVGRVVQQDWISSQQAADMLGGRSDCA